MMKLLPVALLHATTALLIRQADIQMELNVNQTTVVQNLKVIFNKFLRKTTFFMQLVLIKKV